MRRGQNCACPSAARIVALFLAMVPCAASAQVGRIFVSAEAYAGVSRIVHVGKIVALEQVVYDKPLTYIQTLGKPYRLDFQVDETIRGGDVKRLHLVLSLQSTINLEYFRDHSVKLMLAGGPNRLDSFPGAEVGIEEQGKGADGEWYQFRVLDPVNVSEMGPEDQIATQINRSYDSCRMFTNEFEIVVGSKAILKRVRTFAKKYPQRLSAVTLRVPKEFGALCGDPNAFCGITLPVCPETKAALIAIQDDPGLILRRIQSRDEGYNRSLLLAEVTKALSVFSEEGLK